MAKRSKGFDLQEEDEEIVIPQSRARESSKVPYDITGAEKTLHSFQEIPVEMLHPFTLKDGHDFSRHGQVLSDLTVESIKAVGIIEVLIVRPSKVKRDMYEIIAGESRWEHAKAANLKTVPCRIMELSDKAAKSIFNITNVLKRDLTIRDQINGWYEFYSGFRDDLEGAIDELDHAAAEEERLAMQIAGFKGNGLSRRQILRYVKMHNLIPEWLDRLDERKTTGRIGYRIAFFPDEIQKEFLSYKVNEKDLKDAYDVFDSQLKDVAWSDTYIAEHFERLTKPDAEGETEPATKLKLTKEERAQLKKERIYKKAFKAATPKLIDAARAGLRLDDYERADVIITEALKLYYEQKESQEEMSET